MTATATAICGLVLWSVLLSFVLIVVRMTSVFRDGKALNEFHSDGRDMAASGLRVTRAYANAIENLALPAALLLLAITTGNSDVTNGLATAFLGCRILQSIVHIISTAGPMVMIRGGLFTAQNVILIIWAIDLAGIVTA